MANKRVEPSRRLHLASFLTTAVMVLTRWYFTSFFGSHFSVEQIGASLLSSLCLQTRSSWLNGKSSTLTSFERARWGWVWQNVSRITVDLCLSPIHNHGIDPTQYFHRCHHNEDRGCFNSCLTCWKHIHLWLFSCIANLYRLVYELACYLQLDQFFHVRLERSEQDTRKAGRNCAFRLSPAFRILLGNLCYIHLDWVGSCKPNVRMSFAITRLCINVQQADRLQLHRNAKWSSA